MIALTAGQLLELIGWFFLGFCIGRVLGYLLMHFFD